MIYVTFFLPSFYGGFYSLIEVNFHRNGVDKMSQMTRIRITHEQGFKSKECLQRSLEMHYLSSSCRIIQEGDKYQLNLTLSVRDRNNLLLEKNLKEKLRTIVETILPTYTKLLAKSDFEIKGFNLKEEKQEAKEKEMIFERKVRIDGEYIPEQITLKIRGNDSLTIDTQNFRGKSCLHATSSFEEDIGQVIHREMKPESATNTRRVVDREVQDKRLLEIQLRH